MKAIHLVKSLKIRKKLPAVREKVESYWATSTNSTFPSTVSETPIILDSMKRSSVSLTAWPRDPFKKKVSSRASVKESSESSEEDSEELTSEEELFERREAYIKELKRRIPCKPDCDSRFYPHCTAECKCDYLYPAVQRFLAILHQCPFS
ncbi:hypothetical protein COOONC_04175 [Cooperia oncophora]